MTYAEIDKPVIQMKHSDNLTDRWLNSRVAAFTSKAIKNFENYNTTEVIREFEQCVDDVSNWYVRINRRRFWKEALDTDKQSAYNTLYYAIKELSQVMAPILPFMTEHIWQKMTLSHETTAEESIHLSAFPAARHFDSSLLANVENVRKIIAQALKLRNEQNLKVKQPLSALYLDKSCKFLLAYESVICDELNIKEIIYLDDFDVLSHEYVILNFQVAGRILKGDLNKVKSLCDNLSSAENKSLVNMVKQGKPIVIEGYCGELSANCFILAKKDKANVTRSADSVFVAINTEITPALKAEGLYREILRNCQLLRKEAGYAISDRVALAFETDSEIIKLVLVDYAKDIERETLSEIKEIPSPAMHKNVDLDDGVITISII